VNARKIRSKVVDIRSTDPSGEFRFIVDTNAWYWLTYTRASHLGPNKPKARQAEQYSRFIGKAIDAGSTIFRCELALAELAHIIERAEKEIYCFYRKRHLHDKEFRHDTDERPKVVAEIISAWQQVKSMSESATIQADASLSDASLQTLKSAEIDGYDSFYYQTMLKSEVHCVLTDDADYATLPNLVVLTSNVSLIAEATQIGQIGSANDCLKPSDKAAS
jgi:hypothetical protein